MAIVKSPEAPADPPRVLAAIDIGSNSLKMTVARSRPDGGIEETAWRSATVRLGAGLDQTGRLADDRMAAALAALADFAAEARAIGAERIIAVATEATRVAANGPEFLERVRRETGIEVAAISGDHEAHLTFYGLAASTDVSGRVLVADVGGGSTELIAAEEGQVRSARSLPLGSGRLTDRLVGADPPTPDELAACRAAAAELLADAVLPRGPGLRLIAVGGTGEYAMRLLPDRAAVTPAEIDGLLDRLTRIAAADLAAAIAIPEARARVLPAGVAIVAAIADRARPDTVAGARSGIRAGLLMAAFAGEL